MGRDYEISQVAKLLTEEGCRLVTVTGRGGVGKTALACEVARRLVSAPTFATSVVRLEAIDDSARIPELIAASLGLPAYPGTSMDSLAAAIGHSRALVVIDSMEHLLDGAHVLTELLARVATLQFLVTSQAPLQARAERVVRLSALAVEAAVALYCRGATAVDHRFVPDEKATSVIGELCRRLEGVPLAIELAAARAVSVPAAVILRRLDDRPLELLRRPAPDVPSRQHDMSSAIAWTVSLLAPRQQTLFERLTVVVGEFGIDTVEALADTPESAIDDLAVLVDFHLVSPDAGAGVLWFHMPPTIRAFGKDRLQCSPDHDDIRRRHVRASAIWALQAAPSGPGPGEADWRTDIERRSSDLVACLEAASDFGDHFSAVDLVRAMAPWWRAHGFRESERLAIERALRMCTDFGRDDAAFSSALGWSVALTMQQRPALAMTMATRLTEAEAMARRSGDPHAILLALAGLVLMGHYSPTRGAAQSAAEEGLALALRVRDIGWTALFEVWRGMLAHVTGDLPCAWECGIRGLTAARQAGHQRSVVLATLLLNPLKAQLGIQDAAIPAAPEAAELARAAGERMLMVLLLPQASAEAVLAGDVRMGARYAIEALLIAETAPTVGPVLALVASMQVLAAAERLDDVVWLGALLTVAAPYLATALPPSYNDRHLDTLRRARCRLGKEQIDAAERRAVGSSPLKALPEVVALLRSLPMTVAVPIATAAPSRASTDLGVLTDRQIDVLRALAEGRTNKEIADLLHMAPKTVMHHLTAVYRLIGARSRSEATAWAMRRGLVN